MSEWVRPGLRTAQLATARRRRAADRMWLERQDVTNHDLRAGARRDRRRPARPAGLHATVYANGLKLMSAFAFDARGRLWVTTSGANTHATDGLYFVSRAGARPVRIAGRFRGPLGLVWIRGRLYVASLGRVQVLSGLTGNHFAARTDDPRRAAGRR